MHSTDDFLKYQHLCLARTRRFYMYHDIIVSNFRTIQRQGCSGFLTHSRNYCISFGEKVFC
ncbi:hypothetical protein DESC_390012 [Desulfosarcina cetonica]|nr:hypothetical protein DESC_390012 [Desulfosarcina cetonica]